MPIYLENMTHLLSANFVSIGRPIVKPCPAEPRYTLPLQTV